jgi:aspartyl/glutamyl-tRNA(Asn/Gln) amidotransferase C subunit
MSELDIQGLAKLARLEVSAEEARKLQEEIPNILRFVETIQNVDVPETTMASSMRNVVRADADPHESGVYTEALLSAAPARVGNRIAVKQVVSRKKAQ